MNRREFVLGTFATALLGLEGYFGADLYRTSRKVERAQTELKRTSPPPSDKDVSEAKQILGRYSTCEEQVKVGQKSVNECEQLMQTEAKEIYSASRVLDKHEVYQETSARVLTPLNDRQSVDAAVMIWGVGIGLGAALGTAFMKHTGA